MTWDPHRGGGPLSTEWLRATFGASGVRVVPPDVLPPPLRTSPAFRALTEIGLPRGLGNVVLISSNIVSGPETMAGMFARNGTTAPPHLADLYRLGTFGYGSCCLDADTGRVGLVLVSRPDLLPLPISSGLELFIRFLHDIASACDSAAPPIPGLIEHLTRLDPDVMGELSPWPHIIELVAAECREDC